MPHLTPNPIAPESSSSPHQLSSASMPAMKPDLTYSGPAIVQSGLIIDTTYKAVFKAYQCLTGPGNIWYGQTDEPGRAFSFHQITLGTSILGVQMPDRERGTKIKFVDYLIRLNYFDPGVNRIAESDEPPHNHFRPIGVLPIALDGVSNDEAYKMTWERRKAGHVVEDGVMSIRCGQAYGIEDYLDVYHAVYTSRPHISVVIGQFRPALPDPDRAPAVKLPLDNIETARLAMMFKDVLGRYLYHTEGRKI